MLRLPAAVATALAFAVAAPTAHALEVVARNSDGGRDIALQRGDRLRLSLGGESPSTGYAWRKVRKPSRKVLRRRSDRYVAAPAAPGVVGGPGRREIVWRAVGRGTTRLTLRLYPPARDSEPVETFRLTVTVR